MAGKVKIFNKIYNKACQKYIWFKSKACVLDLRLQGATVAWSTTMEGKMFVSNANLLFISKNVHIGAAVRVTTKAARVEIGENSQLSSNVRLDAMGGDICIGANVLINTFTIVTAWSGVKIGNNVLIAPFCHLTDRNHGVEKNTLIKDQTGTSASITINQDVWIGSSSVILQGVKIGEGAVVGANSTVNKPIDDYTIVAGSPARIIGKRK